MKSKKTKKIVVIGGGTGTFVALSGLKNYDLELSAIVTMMDSGGSTGRLRDQLGVLPPGDLRQVLVALSESDKLWRDLFVYRFSKGDLKGHNFGNIFISVLEKTTGSIEQAIDAAAHILNTRGSVIPVTFSKSELCVKLQDGTVVESETLIDEPKNRSVDRIETAYLKPPAKANVQALDAILDADMVVLGPGDLYTSIIPNLLVEGIKDALQNTKAKRVFVMNLMTKYGQTTDYAARDHIDDLSRYIGQSIDVVLMNKTIPDKQALSLYQNEKEDVVNGELINTNSYVVQNRDLLDSSQHQKSKGDVLIRSLIRHDPDKLAKALVSLL